MRYSYFINIKIIYGIDIRYTEKNEDHYGISKNGD